MPKIKAKKSVKKAQTKSADQIAASRIDCPGVGMFRLDQLKPAGYNPRVSTWAQASNQQRS